MYFCVDLRSGFVLFIAITLFWIPGYMNYFRSKSSLHMMTSSNGDIFRNTGHLCGEVTVPSEFPAQRPVTRSFDVFFDLRLNKRLSKQWWGWWFETSSPPLWLHRNVKCYRYLFGNITSTDYKCYFVLIRDLNLFCLLLSYSDLVNNSLGTVNSPHKYISCLKLHKMFDPY